MSDPTTNDEPTPGFHLRYAQLKIRAGCASAQVQAFDGDQIIEGARLRLDDPVARDKFVERVLARRNGQGPDRADIERRLLTILQEATTPKEGGDDGDDDENKSQATILVELALEHASLFRDGTDEPYARLDADGHAEIWPTHSKGFRLWLAGLFFKKTATASNSSALSDALNVLDAKARFEGPCQAVYLRVAPDGAGGLYVDLGDPAWRAVHVTPAGWRLVPDPPVSFRRSAGMLALPDPVAGGNLADLWGLANVPDPDARALVQAWLLATFRDTGPYPILALSGEQGSAKSTLARMLRALIDPAQPDLRRPPKELRDLAIAARHSWVVGYDNISHIEPWLSDGLCCLSTGIGFATRELYTDFDEALFAAKRPSIVNGITEYITRGDLLDRAIQVTLPAIAEDRRREETALWHEFESLRPKILGALLDNVAGALRVLPSVHLTRRPRMADFATWAVACERARQEASVFLHAYSEARAQSHTQAIESSVIGPVLGTYLANVPDDGPPWEGTATDLLTGLNLLADEKARRAKGWPLTPRALTNELRRLAPALRATGIAVELGERRGKDRARIITISRNTDPPERVAGTSSASSASSAGPKNGVNTPESGGSLADDRRTIGADDGALSSAYDGVADDRADEADAAMDLGGGIVRLSSAEELAYLRQKTALADDADDADDVPPTFSDAGALFAETVVAVTRAEPAAPTAVLLTDQAGIERALPELLAAPVVGLDCETTGLDPRTTELRLVQLATAERVYLVDCFRVSPKALAPILDGAKLLVGHNLKFDLGFLAHAGLPVPNGDRLFDTMLAAQLLAAGGEDFRRCGLAAVAKRLLGVELDKTHQAATWAGPLSDEQLRYAARDAAILLPLREKLAAALKDACLERTARIEHRCLPAVVWLEATGAPFDAERWQALSDQAVAEQIRLEAELTTRAGVADMLGNSTVNWSSAVQVAGVLGGRGHAVETTDGATLLGLEAAGEPLARLLLDYREAGKKAGTYGIEWLTHVYLATGRIHADFLQVGAESGRMACQRPNLQQVPRDKAYRACFRPAEGRVLVKADYSQIELRIAAEITGDAALLTAYKQGEDVHTLTASRVLGRPVDQVRPEDRQAAKALNFGLLYGMGAKTLQEYAASSYGVHLSQHDASRLWSKFFQTYTGLRRWHRSYVNRPIETRTLADRRRLDVGRFTEKLNTPVQGTGADGLKAALALLWERRERCPSAAPVLAVHDEIVIECDRTEAAAARDWLVRAMKDGMGAFLRLVPVGVEATIAADWSGTEVRP